jgi:hypothetical protein
VLNIALFGMTAREWLKVHPRSGNLRDQATIEQLVVLSNLESINAVFIRQELSQRERLVQLNLIAIRQLTTLLNSSVSATLGLSEKHSSV